MIEAVLIIVIALIQQYMGAPMWASWAVAWIYARIVMRKEPS